MSSTVIKGLNILETMIAAENPIGATEVARLCDMTKSNAHRMLKVLEAEGYLIQSFDNKTFAPSLKVWELGNTIISRLHFVKEAQSILRWVADEIGEAVHLALYDSQDAVTISQIESRHAVRAFTEVAGRAPAYAVATGKSMLAFQPESEVESVCKRLRPITPNSIIQPQILRDQLDQIRQTRVAINNEEWRTGVRGLAVPILDANNVSVLSVGICGPSNRVVPELDAMHGNLLLRAGRDLSEKLGLSPRQSETLG